jgi:hypothetical protein
MKADASEKGRQLESSSTSLLKKRPEKNRLFVCATVFDVSGPLQKHTSPESEHSAKAEQSIPASRAMVWSR